MQSFSDIYNDTEHLNDDDQDLFIKMIIAEYLKCLIVKFEKPEDKTNEKAISSIELFLRFLTSKNNREIAREEMPDVIKYLHRRKETDA